MIPRVPKIPVEPKSLPEETEIKLTEIIAYFSKEGYELPTTSNSTTAKDQEKKALSEREMMFLVGIYSEGQLGSELILISLEKGYYAF